MGHVLCAACAFIEKKTAKAGLMDDMACGKCGEVKARFMPGTTPIEPPWQCECGNDLFVLKGGGLFCIRCNVKPKHLAAPLQEGRRAI